ncbi:MAG: adenylate/guanylate cyclase domain-containing protein [Leptolyngbya sp. RL_3_1]|nr:adenylate/guanylate cyclase domain-containing protein [Leptolyngbya sp. RL_3_1]
MASLLQSSVGLLRSRLSRRIVGWVFLSLVVIEGIIFVPSYHRRRQEKLRDLEELSQEVLFTIKNNSMGGMAPADLVDSIETMLKPGSVIAGVALYEADGNLVDSFGEIPMASWETVAAGQLVRQTTQGGSRYDVAWPSDRFQDQYILMVRHDATSVQRDMRLYVLGITGLVIIIAVFVTFVTVIVLERLLIVPILHLRDDLRKAGEAVSQDQPPNFYTRSLQRNDELGEVANAFCDMYAQIHQEISDRKAAETALKAEQAKSEKLLLNILPMAIAEQLKAETGAIASRFDAATILFADIVDFTGLSAEMSPSELVQILNRIFSTFDCIADSMGLEKIKTIGDAYMVVGGLPERRPDHAEAILALAIRMQQEIKTFRRADGSPFHLRIGINTGPVVAGVIGIKKFSYDLWGDAVNIASRMESHGVADRIHISANTYEHLKDRYPFEDRGCITIKGRGEMHTYLYAGDDLAQPSQPADWTSDPEISITSYLG